MKAHLCALLFVAASITALSAQETQFKVRLSQPISTATSHKGDPVAARVVSPDDFKGDTIRGTITDSKSGASAVLSVAFDTLEHGGTRVPISTTVTSLANSKGQQNTDEDGHSVHQSNRTGNSNAARQIGSSIGGFLGGRKGAALSTATDVAAALVTVQISGQGPNLSFAAGSQFAVSVTPRGGPEIATLPPNPPSGGEPASGPAVASAAPIPTNGPSAATTDTMQTAPQDAQPDLKAVKIDFIPGEKTIFYDDFSDMAQDEPPPHWKLRDGKVELRTGGNIQQLTTVCPTKLSLSSTSFPFPKNFTVEIEAVFSTDQPDMDWLAWPSGVEGGEAPSWRIIVSGGELSMVGPAGETIGSFHFSPKAENRPIKIALWVQNGRARGYVDGERFADVNQMFVPANVKPADHWTIRQRCDRPEAGWMGIRSVRVAESTPDFSSLISTSGKYVTHGILFDTDSNRLKPESAPVLKSIVQGLQKNPNLKLEIDGFTDSTGEGAHNLDLSKRRAETVRSVLVSQFSIDGSRLTSNGFGADKAIASNDTPDGRAQNRRVEFIKR